ncbi:MAG: hypothetical protein KA053_05735 [Lentimicrobiaceae bacterium]|nr:hypothetical protein [Lentimicrobiaceae bacterium]
MMKKVLFLDTTHPMLPVSLEQHGFICDHLLQSPREEVAERIHEYEGIVIRSRIPIDAQLLERARSLRFIARVGAGMENIDHPYALSRGIVCLNAPEGNRDAVGEHAVGMLLALMNHLIRCDQEVRQGLWKREPNRGTELMGKTVALIGYGNTGSAFARKLSGFDVRTIAFDKYKKGYSDSYVRESDMNEVFREADILSLHIPLTTETDHLVNADYLSRFSKPIMLINTSRGRNVCTADLVDALESGKVSGAALDVLEYERSSLEALQPGTFPAPLRALVESPHVILSPHVAGWTHESLVKLASILVGKILALYP